MSSLGENQNLNGKEELAKAPQSEDKGLRILWCS